MNTPDMREELLDIINGDIYTEFEAAESAGNDNVILLSDDDDNRYKLTIEKL